MGWAHPTVGTVATFSAVCKLLGLILEVAKTGTPRMTRLALIDVADSQHNLVSVWAGKSASADPYDRIVELNKEILELRDQLADAIAKQQENEHLTASTTQHQGN